MVEWGGIIMKDNHKSLWLVWQNAKTRLFYHVGTLSFYDNKYNFNYTFHNDGPQKVRDALKNGYMLHPSFPNLTKEYISANMFAAFKRRLPSEIRVDFENILEDLHLGKNYSDMDLLERTRGKLGNDQYSFEQPLRVVNGKLVSSFYINGMHYQENLPSNWADILKSFNKVELKLETENPVDKNAVAVYTNINIKLGYVPRFYATGISALLKNGIEPVLEINYINEKASSDWWVKLDFECAISELDKKKIGSLDPIFEDMI